MNIEPKTIHIDTMPPGTITVTVTTSRLFRWRIALAHILFWAGAAVINCDTEWIDNG